MILIKSNESYSELKIRQATRIPLKDEMIKHKGKTYVVKEIKSKTMRRPYGLRDAPGWQLETTVVCHCVDNGLASSTLGSYQIPK